MIKGKTIDHVAAFSPYTGEWSMQHLLKPVEEEINPVVGPGSALYQAGNDFYAFSARRGTWGVLHLEGQRRSHGRDLAHGYRGHARKPAVRFQPEARRVVQGRGGLPAAVAQRRKSRKGGTAQKRSH